jgi:hypothetical protein
MCHFRSGIAVLNITDNTIKVFILPNNDSHTECHKEYKIRDDASAGATKQTPLEYIPQGGLDEWDKYALIFDASKPNWWEEEHTIQAIRQFQQDIAKHIKSNQLSWNGYLNLSSLTALPENANIKAGGDLYLSSLRTLPENAKLEAGGDLDLRNLTALPENAKLEAGRYLDLSSLTALPENAKLKAGGSLYLSSLTTLPENANIKAGGNLNLSSLTALPENANIKAGGNLDLSSLTALPENANKIKAKNIILKK